MSKVSQCNGRQHVFDTFDYPEHLVTLDVANPEKDHGDGVTIEELVLGAGAVHGAGVGAGAGARG